MLWIKKKITLSICWLRAYYEFNSRLSIKKANRTLSSVHRIGETSR